MSAVSPGRGPALLDYKGKSPGNDVGGGGGVNKTSSQAHKTES